MSNVISRTAAILFGVSDADRVERSRNGGQIHYAPSTKIWRRNDGSVVPRGRSTGRTGFNPEPWSAEIHGRWPNHVWRYEILVVHPRHSAPFETFVVVDEFTEEWLTLRVRTKLESRHVVQALRELVADRGTPARLRRASGSDKIAASIVNWLLRSEKFTRHCEAPPLAGPDGRQDSLRKRLTGVIRENAMVVTYQPTQALAETWFASLNARAPQSMGRAHEAVRCHAHQAVA